MSIHKEGRNFLFFTLIILLLLNLVVEEYSASQTIILLVNIASLVVFIFLLQFFRDPHRKINTTENGVLAPADGKVVVVEKTMEDEYLKEERIQISIFMSPINVHSNRSPVDGSISFAKYHPGKYLVAWHPKSSTENERTSIVFKLSSGLEIMTRQIAGAMARRIKYYVKPGDQVKQGDEYGFIKFGSRVDLYLPLDADIKVKPGDIVRSGLSVIALLKN